MSTTSIPPLSQRINTATRPLHTNLNTLILSLLPLALPPHASSPELYTLGVSHILPIYEAFEGELSHIHTLWGEDGSDESQSRHAETNSIRKEESAGSEEEQEILLRALARLHIPSLIRTTRLKDDIAQLSHVHNFTSTDGTTNQSPQLPPRLNSLLTHLHISARLNPYLLLAPTWLLYMALFSGGRHILALLQRAGPAFWQSSITSTTTSSHSTSEEHPNTSFTTIPPLTFWTFTSPSPSNPSLDPKTASTQYFAETEQLLSSQQQEEVVQEAVYIMGAMIGVVEEIAATVEKRRLDDKVPKKGNNREERWDGEEEMSIGFLLAKHILPMGMAELMSAAAKAVVLGMEALGGTRAATVAALEDVKR